MPDINITWTRDPVAFGTTHFLVNGYPYHVRNFDLAENVIKKAIYKPGEAWKMLKKYNKEIANEK